LQKCWVYQNNNSKSKLRYRIVINVKLLREYVKLILNEDGDVGGDFGGGGLGDFAASDSPFGMQLVGNDALKNTFLAPFFDVARTVAGKGGETSIKAQTLLKTAFESLATTFLPMLSDDYAKIFSKEQNQIEKLKQQYKPVYDATWNSLLDSDVQFLAMLYSPKLFFAADFLRKAPASVMSVASIMSGGRLDGVLSKIKNAFHITDKKSSGNDSHYNNYESSLRAGDLLHEDDAKPKKDVVSVLSSEKLVNAFLDSPETQRAQQSAQKIVRGALTQAYNTAKGIADAKSVEDLSRITGRKIDLSKLKSLPQEDMQQAEQQLLKAVKASSKQFIVKNLLGQVQAARKANVPENSQYILDYNRVIQKIRSL